MAATGVTVALGSALVAGVTLAGFASAASQGLIDHKNGTITQTTAPVQQQQAPAVAAAVANVPLPVSAPPPPAPSVPEPAEATDPVAEIVDSALDQATKAEAVIVARRNAQPPPPPTYGGKRKRRTLRRLKGGVPEEVRWAKEVARALTRALGRLDEKSKSPRPPFMKLITVKDSAVATRLLPVYNAFASWRSGVLTSANVHQKGFADHLLDDIVAKWPDINPVFKVLPPISEYTAKAEELVNRASVTRLEEMGAANEAVLRQTRERDEMAAVRLREFQAAQAEAAAKTEAEAAAKEAKYQSEKAARQAVEAEAAHIGVGQELALPTSPVLTEEEQVARDAAANRLFPAEPPVSVAPNGFEASPGEIAADKVARDEINATKQPEALSEADQQRLDAEAEAKWAESAPPADRVAARAEFEKMEAAAAKAAAVPDKPAVNPDQDKIDADVAIAKAKEEVNEGPHEGEAATLSKEQLYVNRLKEQILGREDNMHLAAELSTAEKAVLAVAAEKAEAEAAAVAQKIAAEDAAAERARAEARIARAAAARAMAERAAAAEKAAAEKAQREAEEEAARFQAAKAEGDAANAAQSAASALNRGKLSLAAEEELRKLDVPVRTGDREQLEHELAIDALDAASADAGRDSCADYAKVNLGPTPTFVPIAGDGWCYYNAILTGAGVTTLPAVAFIGELIPLMPTDGWSGTFGVLNHQTGSVDNLTYQEYVAKLAETYNDGGLRLKYWPEGDRVSPAVVEWFKRQGRKVTLAIYEQRAGQPTDKLSSYDLVGANTFYSESCDGSEVISLAHNGTNHFDLFVNTSPTSGSESPALSDGLIERLAKAKIAWEALRNKVSAEGLGDIKEKEPATFKNKPKRRRDQHPGRFTEKEGEMGTKDYLARAQGGPSTSSRRAPKAPSPELKALYNAAVDAVNGAADLQRDETAITDEDAITEMQLDYLSQVEAHFAGVPATRGVSVPQPPTGLLNASVRLGLPLPPESKKRLEKERDELLANRGRLRPKPAEGEARKATRERSIADINARIAEIDSQLGTSGGRRRKTPRHNKKTRKSTFRRNRKH